MSTHSGQKSGSQGSKKSAAGASSKPAGDGAERRKARRRSILGTFSLFIVVPKKGIHRLEIHDMSDGGLGFNIDIEGEDPADFPVKLGDALELRFYLNQTLYLPLDVRIARITDGAGEPGESASVRRVGAEFADKSGKGYQAFQAFLKMFDAVVDAARIDPPGSL